MTEAEREAALKDQSSKFMRQHRVVKRLVSKTNDFVTDLVLDSKALDASKRECNAAFYDLSEMFDLILEITDGSAPAAIKADFEKVESDCSALTKMIFSRVPKLADSDSLSIRSDSDSVSSVASAPASAAQSQVVDKLCEQVVLGRLASAEPDIFSGDPLEYAEWLNSFKALVTCRGVPETETIYYLKKYLSGPALRCVKGVLGLATPAAYKRALKLLEERFGSQYIVATAFREKLCKWPKISKSDHVGLREFADYLVNIEVAKETNPSLGIFDDQSVNCELLAKLPDSMVEQWKQHVSDELDSGRAYPNFSVFSKFVYRKAKAQNVPTTPFSALQTSGSDSNSRSRGHVASGSNRRSNFSQDSRSNRKFSHAAHVEGQSQNSCFYCNEAHFMTNCSGFLSLSPSARRDFCKSENLCFGCLRHGHSSKYCRRRLRCATCNRNHPTVLHDDSWQTRNFSQDSGSTNSNNRPPNSYYNHSQRN